MAKSEKTGGGSGSESTKAKRVRNAERNARQATHSSPPCDRCAFLQYPLTHSVLNNPLSNRLRIALVDADQTVHDFARKAFKAHAQGWVLESYPSPASAFGSPSDTLKCLQSRPPTISDILSSPAKLDVVVIDVSTSDLSVIACARRLRARLPNARIVVLTDCVDHKAILEAVLAGARGYLIKPVAPQHLVWALCEVAQGRAFLCVEAQTALMDYTCQVGAVGCGKRLSCRERTVMLFLMGGGTNKEVARELGISEGTLHWHLDNIYRKLHVHGKDAALRDFVVGMRLPSAGTV
jgi:DNA-binding NarL/FixJ family response regulator